MPSKAAFGEMHPSSGYRATAIDICSFPRTIEALPIKRPFSSTS